MDSIAEREPQVSRLKMFAAGGTLAALSSLGLGLAANSADAGPRPEPITQGSIEDVETGAACGFEEESPAADAQNLTDERLTLRIDYLNNGTIDDTRVLEPKGDEDNKDQVTVTEDKSGPEVAFTVDDKDGKFVAKYYPCHVEPTPTPTPEPTSTTLPPSPTQTPEPTPTSESPTPTPSETTSPTPEPTDTCIARIATRPPDCETPSPTPEPTETATPTATPTTQPTPRPSGTPTPTPTTTVTFKPKPKATPTQPPAQGPAPGVVGTD